MLENMKQVFFLMQSGGRVRAQLLAGGFADVTASVLWNLINLSLHEFPNVTQSFV